MKRLLLLLVLTAAALGQSNRDIVNLNIGSSLPATCFTGQTFSLTGTNAGIYQCSSANTWVFAAANNPNLFRDCRLDGVKADAGTTDNTTPINNCLANAFANGQIALLPSGQINYGSGSGKGINMTNMPGAQLWGEGDTLANGVGSDHGTQLVCQTGGPACVDITGSSNVVLAGFQIKGQTGTVGILHGRDNAAGGGNGQFCFASFFRIHDISILMTSQPTANNNFGAIGIANLGAEDGIYENINILADRPAYLSALNDIPLTSAYQTLYTGCTASMSDATFINANFNNLGTANPDIDGNVANNVRIVGNNHFGAGSAAISLRNSGGATASFGWTVRGNVEGAPANVLTTSVALNNMDFQLSTVAGAGLSSYLNCSSNVTLSGGSYSFGSNGAKPFISNNTCTLQGLTAFMDAATTAANVTLIAVTINAPAVTRANLVFNTASIYDAHASDVDMYAGNLVIPVRTCIYMRGFGSGITPDANWTQCIDGSDNFVWKMGVQAGRNFIWNNTSVNIAKLDTVSGVFTALNTQRLTADATPISASSAATATVVFTWGALPVSSNFSFSCKILYNQQTAAGGIGLAVQGATNAPTRLDSWGTINTTNPASAAPAESQGSALNITNTTGTSVVTATPSAITTVFQAELNGTIQVGASASTLNILMFTQAGADTVTPKAGSFCTITP